MAAALAQIHDVRGPALAAVDPFRPWYPLDAVRIPARSRHPEWWQTALVLASSVPAATAPCFLHRDYHPANTIWRGGHLAGVVDWTSASTGQAAMDLAHWRANLGTRHGIEVADRVLPAYRAVTGGLPVAQPWWDVRIVLDFLDEPDAMAGDDLAGLEAYLGALLRRA
jgi:aminoglycoside phosphotransferase (APT) family kinase protein